ncbi:MAG: EscU/YscU/HrcU family type III secretion system export apparatus switch protein, partial [Armatimonadetes bacterium]|nr:EscU/YscU/HrcU family type III secretion system export apparatus switch protein [Armatimonadota bacterium]
IKALARRYGIPVREQPPLARALYAACPVGATIPPALYQAVAVILAELYRESVRRQARHTIPPR